MFIYLSKDCLRSDKNIPDYLWSTLFHKYIIYRLAKFDPKVGSRRTTKFANLVFLIIILVVLILLPYYMYMILVFILLSLLVRER